MRDFILEIFERIIIEILNVVWFFVRPVVYLNLIWISMKIATLIK